LLSLASPLPACAKERDLREAASDFGLDVPPLTGFYNVQRSLGYWGGAAALSTWSVNAYGHVRVLPTIFTVGSVVLQTASTVHHVRAMFSPLTQRNGIVSRNSESRASVRSTISPTKVTMSVAIEIGN
jgi:hypothetical protein